MNNILISIVIPAYNSEGTIAQAIHAALDQGHKNIEVIVVDDGSTDQTAAIVRSFPSVKYLHQDNAGPASARNHGAFAAKGEILFFTDSDCVPEHDWVERSLLCFKDRSIAAVAGSYGIMNSEDILARCIHAEILYRHQHLMPLYPKVFGSYNVAIRRDIFLRLDGFDPSYRMASGEDNDLSYRILQSGSKIYFEKRSIVKHYHQKDLGKYLKEQSRHGFWRVKMYLAHPQMVKGDDYTFWKDVAELPLSGLVVLLFLLMLFSSLALKFFLMTVFFFSMMEFYVAFLVMRSFIDGIYFGFVMFFRAFSRSLGFLTGIFSFLLKKTPGNS